MLINFEPFEPWPLVFLVLVRAVSFEGRPFLNSLSVSETAEPTSALL